MRDKIIFIRNARRCHAVLLKSGDFPLSISRSDMSEFDFTRHVRSNPIFHQKGNVRCQTFVFRGKLSSQNNNKSWICSPKSRKRCISKGDSYKQWWLRLIDRITEHVLWASCEFNYSFAEESDRVNTFNCYPCKVFATTTNKWCCNYHGSSANSNHQHQDSDLPFDLTSHKRSQTPARGWTLRWSGRKLDHRHRTGDQRLKDKLSLSDKLMD